MPDRLTGPETEALLRPPLMEHSEHAPAFSMRDASSPPHFAEPEFYLHEMTPSRLHQFLEYIHKPPACLNRPGEAMQYLQLVDRWTAYLHAHLAEALIREPWRLACSHFAQNANWMTLYFADADLRPLYDRRGDILEVALRNLGYPVDHRFGPRPSGQRRIKVGILNAHFSESAETRATLPVFAHLDPGRFEVNLYAGQLTGQPLEKYCAARAARLVQLPRDASAQITFLRREALDILFYGTNLTAVMHPLVLLALHRLARVQVTSFCSPVTTGLRNMDCFVAGTWTECAGDPPQRFRERLIRFPGSGICFDQSESPAGLGFSLTRRDLGIPPESTVFVSGANYFKIIPELREAWVEILAAAPNSYLVLYPFGPAWSASYEVQEFRRSFAEICRKAAVRFSRVKFLNALPSPGDLPVALRLADVYLDSFPYSGATSLLDPLAVGLPTLAMDGGVLRFSQASALLRELGLQDLVAPDRESYIRLAISLAGEPSRRRTLSERISDGMRHSPPFLDSRAHSARMGALFEQLLREWLS